MTCPGCYKPTLTGYCLPCRKALFGGRLVTPVLPYDAPKADNVAVFQEQTKRLSISGMQLKYSVRLEGKQLLLTESGGQYILKPIPPTPYNTLTSQAPANEHLTMQLADQLFNIPTAANGLVYFKDGTPAYLVRRFDVKKDGSKYQQEDMAQVAGRSKEANGEHFKYDGSYAEIAALIRQHVAAYPPALETFFRLVLFNYLFSNGDAHWKNFSLIRTEMGDYGLSPAYDLMATVLHTPLEADTALDLYPGSINSSFYSTYGYYGQSDFRALADAIGLVPSRRNRIIDQFLSSKPNVLHLAGQSSLSDEAKAAYLHAYTDKLARMGVTAGMIGRFMHPDFPGVYAPTQAPVKILLLGKVEVTGFFDRTRASEGLENENKYTFVETRNAKAYLETKDEQHVTVIDGDMVLEMEKL